MTEYRPKIELLSAQFQARLNRLLERLQLRSNFAVDPERAQTYYQLDRSRELMRGGYRDVPIGSSSTVRYHHEHGGHITDRPMSSYMESLFPDEYVKEDYKARDKRLTETYGQNWSWRRHMAPAIRREDLSQVVNGGTESTFGSGKVVVNLGSGEAIGDIQLSQAYPDTTFIAVDTGYGTEKQPKLNKPGLQLVKDDWNTLAAIPDDSIDTILSLQGAFTWGFRSNDEAVPLIKTITRVAKEGATLRFDLDISQATSDATEQGIFEILKQHGWETQVVDRTVIAKLANKKRSGN